MSKKNRQNDVEAQYLAQHSIEAAVSQISVVECHTSTGSSARTIIRFAIGEGFETILALDVPSVEALAKDLPRCLEILKGIANANDPQRN